MDELNKDNLNLLHHIASSNNYDAMETISKLSYFKDVVNVQVKSDDIAKSGWTPILVSVRSNPNGADFDML